MFKRVKINLLQKPIRTILLTATLILVLSFFFFATLIFHASNTFGNDVLEQISGEVVIYSESGEVLKNADDIAKEIEKIDGVEGILAFRTQGVEPVNFENVKDYQGENPFNQKHLFLHEDEAELISHTLGIIGITNINLYSDFVKEYSTLAEGEFPSEDNQGLLISEQLAKQNNVAVGDYLEFSPHNYGTMDTGQTYIGVGEKNSYKIIGIYSTILEFIVTENNEEGAAIIASSPYNKVYSDYNTICEISNLPNTLESFSVILESAKDTDSVIESIKQLDYNWNGYNISNIMDGQVIMRDLQSFMGSNTMLLALSFVGGILIFIIIFSLFNDNREIGIMMCLGERKGRLLRQRLFEYTMLILVAVPIALLVGFFVAVILSEPLDPELALYDDRFMQATQIYSTGELGDKYYNAELTVNISVGSIFLVVGFAIMILLIMLLIAKFVISKYDVKKFLQSEE